VQALQEGSGRADDSCMQRLCPSTLPWDRLAQSCRYSRQDGMLHQPLNRPLLL
jgi:hypothetical protein